MQFPGKPVRRAYWPSYVLGPAAGGRRPEDARSWNLGDGPTVRRSRIRVGRTSRRVGALDPPVGRRPLVGVRVVLRWAVRANHLAVQVILASPSARYVPFRTQAWARRLILPTRRRARRWLSGGRDGDALVIGVERRRDDSVLIYGQFAFLPLPPHQKYEPQLDPLCMCDSMP
jgi:hypothetical protein